jgi:quinol-cytochrome oxidoreductase complex cytochrome b subunit/mono/diheme cytochrome c family protein
VSTESRTSAPPTFWEERTGWSRLKEQLLLEPLPGGARWAAAFGSLLLFSFLVQVLTGILLATTYSPGEKTAWASVKFIQEDLPLGAFIRSVHHWGSSAMVVLLLLHLVQVFVWGAYKRPRELTWMVGVLLLFCVLGLAFTGYLLPWDNKAYWATRVGLGIASTTPGIGDTLRELLQGGSQMGNLTLTRFFTLHAFLLPGLVILLAVVHLYLFRLHGVTPNWWQSPEQLKAAEEPFWPRQALMDSVVALVFLVGLGLWCFYRPAPLEAQANPAEPYEARPEWYFMFLFQLLRYFQGPYEIVGTFALPATFFAVLFFWPLLDRNPDRHPARRPVAMSLLTAGTAGLIGLTIFAIATDVRMKEPALVQAKEPAREAAGPIQQLEIAQVYSTYCVACHGIDGSGKQIRPNMPTIPDFTSLAWQMSQTDLEIVHRIVDGNEPLMPAFRDKLTREQNLGLAVYVRAFAIQPLASAPVAPPAPPPAAPEHPAPAVVAQMPAATVYRAYCLACHDADGRGTTVKKAMPDIPDFTDPKWQTARTNSELAHSILEGKGKFMLAMKDKLGGTDADQMVEYVRKFEGAKVQVEPKELTVPPTPGKAAIVPAGPPRPLPPSMETAGRIRAASVQYREYCLSCHGINGRGAEIRLSMPEIPDFTAPAWHGTRSNSELLVSVLEGKGKLMPAFRGRLTENQAQDLIAYVRAFGPEPAPGAKAPASDFEERFRQLEDQWKALEKQLQELGPKKPNPP